MPVLEAFDAVILAGGAGRRLGGADKPALEVAGATLLERVAAAASGADSTVVVGPRRPSPAARYVSEDPPRSGPVPALRAGLAEVDAPWFALLAGDLPFLEPAHVTLLRSSAMGHCGALLVDAEGRPQWLIGVWHTATVRAALTDYAGHSVRGLLGPLDPNRIVPGEAGDMTAFDCDTPEALAEARAALEALHERRD
ncbi:molybdenum cofactor guanylyltransferase, partial [Spinactinospora alkalitolerans]